MLFCRSINNIFFHNVKYVEFCAKRRVFARNFTFFKKKSATEAHRIFVETYGDHALSKTIRRVWFGRFKNNDFDIENKERFGAPEKFEDKELEALLDEDPCQTQNKLAELLGVDHTTSCQTFKNMRNDSKRN